MSPSPVPAAAHADASGERLALQGMSIGPLRDVSLVVEPGEIVCISGESGAGKSRLLRAVADLEPHSGEVTIGDDRRSAVAAHCWRGWVILVPAESSWWSDTVLEHFLEPVSDSLAAFGLKDEALGWEISRLSSGEKQRLAVLRALSHEPRALLLDEPTANLDPEATRAIENLILTFEAAGTRVLMTTHDLNQARRLASEVIFLHRGRLLEHAPAERFFSAPSDPAAAHFIGGGLLA